MVTLGKLRALFTPKSLPPRSCSNPRKIPKGLPFKGLKSHQAAERSARGYRQIREQLDKPKVPSAKPTEPGPITEEEKKKILDDIDSFLQKEPEED